MYLCCSLILFSWPTVNELALCPETFKSITKSFIGKNIVRVKHKKDHLCTSCLPDLGHLVFLCAGGHCSGKALGLANK